MFITLHVASICHIHNITLLEIRLCKLVQLTRLVLFKHTAYMLRILCAETKQVFLSEYFFICKFSLDLQQAENRWICNKSIWSPAGQFRISSSTTSIKKRGVTRSLINQILCDKGHTSHILGLRSKRDHHLQIHNESIIQRQ